MLSNGGTVAFQMGLTLQFQWLSQLLEHCQKGEQAVKYDGSLPLIG